MSQRDSLPALLVVLLCLLTSGAAVGAPQSLRIDLGAIDPGSERILATAPGEYTIEIVNRLPSAAYDVQVAVSFIPIEPLEIPGARGDEESIVCPEVEAATQELLDASSEIEVAEKVRALEDLLVAGCPDTEPTYRLAMRVIGSTRQGMPYVYQLASGQRLEVTISRRDGSSRKEWTVVFQTAPRGRWFSSYGFVFVPDDDERFFSKAKLGGTNEYVITRKTDNQDYDFAPSLFYSWLPTRAEGRNLSFGAAAGLGFDQSNPVVFAGPMLTYNQNVSLLAGVVMRKQMRLDGAYAAGQEIAENLSEDQLGDETYHPGIFFGLSFRFGANPFADAADASEPAEAAAAAEQVPDAP